MLLQAVSMIVPSEVQVPIFGELDDLPYFNPELDEEPAHPMVAKFRTALLDADAVLISSPEYAHGIPGVLKNALDWVVRSGEFSEKPVAIINASPLSAYIRPALVETLTAMNAHVVTDASLTITLSGKPANASSIVSQPDVASQLRLAIQHLTKAATSLSSNMQGRDSAG